MVLPHLQVILLLLFHPSRSSLYPYSDPVLCLNSRPFRNIYPATQGQNFDVAAQQHLVDSLVAALKTQSKKSQQRHASDNFYRNVGTIAGFGLSITFGLIVTGIADPKEISQHGRLDSSTTRILLAVSWLLFMVVLNLSFSLAQKMPRQSRGCQICVSKIMYLLATAPVICLSLVVASYVEVVGYVGIAFASVVAILALFG